MEYILRKEKQFPFVNAMFDFFSVLDGMEKNMTVELVENLVPRIDMKVIAGIRTFYDLENEVGFLEDLPIPDRSSGDGQFFGNPGFEIECKIEFHGIS
jgi:hypothetical protein